MEFSTKPKLLRDAARAGVLQQGLFTLKSGRTSDYYFDMRRLTLSGRVRTAVASMIECAGHAGIDYDAIGGPSVGADPIVGAWLGMLGMCDDDGPALRGFLVRPVAKDHGLTDLVIGPVGPRDHCLVVEDVTTTGGSLLHAIDAVEASGCKVIGAMALLARTGEAWRKLDERGIPFLSLLTPRDFGIEEDEPK